MQNPSSERGSRAEEASDDEVGEPPKAFLVGLFSAFAYLPIRFFFPRLKTLSRISLAAFMFGGAAMRLDKDAVNGLLLPMVPPPLPKKLCVYASGLVEAICGILLLVPSLSEIGARLTVALLWGVFPANIYQAFSKKAQDETKIRGPILYFRLVFQLLFINWASWFA